MKIENSIYRFQELVHLLTARRGRENHALGLPRLDKRI